MVIDWAMPWDVSEFGHELLAWMGELLALIWNLSNLFAAYLNKFNTKIAWLQTNTLKNQLACKVLFLDASKFLWLHAEFALILFE